MTTLDDSQISATFTVDRDRRISEARAYLGALFPTHVELGCIVFALRDRTKKWYELPPFDVGSLEFSNCSHGDMLDALAVAAVNASVDHDVFISPYLHRMHGRKESGGIERRIVHADIDGHPEIDAVQDLGCFAVASGSVDDQGRPHAHLYIKMTRSVSFEQHQMLCSALGEALGDGQADSSKVKANDLLRPPGTLNHKSESPRPVKWLIAPDAEQVRVWEPEALAEELDIELPPDPDPDPLDDPNGPLFKILEDDLDRTDLSTPEQQVTAAREEGGAENRLSGLLRTVREAPRGEGNSMLNWAAGKAAALDAPEAFRVQLIEAYLSRPTNEPPELRRREAETTIASGWSWGTANPEHALHERMPAGIASEITVLSEVKIEKTDDDALDAFWESRDWLRSLRDFARARRVGPWALLGAVLARAAAAVPPSVVLPPTRGSVASLNLLVAVCGASGSGKSTADAAADEFLEPLGGVEALEASPGSGEGLVSAYGFMKAEQGQSPTWVQTRASVLLQVDEVSALGKLTGRTNSTLLDTLKTAWSGGPLGTLNAELIRQRRVASHTYRLAGTAGVQPANAGVILDDAAGGFPQRWLWMPTFDPGRLGRGERLTEPQPFRWHVPGEQPKIDSTGVVTLPLRTIMRLPQEAVEAILKAAEQQNRPILDMGTVGVDPLDGHALLTRVKVAALLALLDGRGVEVTPDDWKLSGVVMEMSDRTRGEIIAVTAQTAKIEADRRAIRQGRTAAIASDAEGDERIVRTLGKIRETLTDGEEHPVGAVNRKLRRWRDEFREALERLIESGEVERIERNNAKGTQTEYLRLIGGAK